MESGVPTVGHHVLVELFGCEPGRTDDPTLVRESLLAAVRAIGATPVGEVFHRFSPQGVSGVVLIAESHLSCHTWPEAGYVAIDIYTCGALDARRAVDHLRDAFRARTWLLQDILRGLVDLAPPSPVERSLTLVDPRRLHEAGRRELLLRTDGIVELTGIVPLAQRAAVRAEALALLADRPEERGQAPDDRCPALSALLAGRTLLEPLERLTGEPLRPGPWAITREEPSGWGWIGSRYALVWILASPPEPSGGLLQCLPHTDRRDPGLLDRMTDRPIETHWFGPGRIYLLAADTLHRSTPRVGDRERIRLFLPFDSLPDRDDGTVPIGYEPA